MSNLRTLREAFEELEHRADTVAVPAREVAAGREERGPTVPAHRRAARGLAPAAAVVVIAVSAAVWQTTRSGEPASHPAAGSIASSPVGPPSRPHSGGGTASEPPSPPRPAGRFQPPTTAAQLTAQARAILAGTATIAVTNSMPPAPDLPTPTVTPTPTTPNAPGAGPGQRSRVKVPVYAGSGAAIVGTLTAAGQTGGFQLNVSLAPPGGKAVCDEGTGCSVREFGDGSTLAVGTWRDAQVPDGVTYHVEVVRPDGADVSMHLSTERDPKGQSTVTASHVPLTIAQMIGFVTSYRW